MIPTHNIYRRYVASAPGLLNGFPAPALVEPGAPYEGVISEHKVALNGTTKESGWTYDPDSGNIDFDVELEEGTVVEITRATPLAESLVTMGVPTNYDPVAFNKAFTQMLYLIQELWGGLRAYQLRSGLREIEVGSIDAGESTIVVAGAAPDVGEPRFLLNLGGIDHVYPLAHSLGVDIDGNDLVVTVPTSSYNRNWWLMLLSEDVTDNPS